ncbi:MAG: DUF2752 domain-containing protein, partial [Acidimicrobiales bacterium]
MSSAPHARPRAAAVRWTSRDTQPAVTYLSLAGIAAAALLAALGMPPISIHGPLHFVGIMDPLCG